jgi:hypothetical protein
MNVFDRFQASLIKSVPPSNIQNNEDAIIAWLDKHKITLNWKKPTQAILYAGDMAIGKLTIDIYTTNHTAEFRAVFSMNDAAYAVLMLQDRLNEQAN